MCDLSDDDDDHIEITEEDSKVLTFEDYLEVNKILRDIYGVNVIELACKYILSGKLNSMDLVVQALSYKMQKLSRGIGGIRYLPSWGCFWASVREIVRARGLVPFLDHFEVDFCLYFLTKLLILNLEGVNLTSWSALGFFANFKRQIKTRLICLASSVKLILSWS